MVEESKAVDHKKRARNIFESVFEEAFLTCGGRGLNLDQCQAALSSLLQGNVSEELKDELDKFFY